MAAGSRAYNGLSFTFDVDDTGVLKAWPLLGTFLLPHLELIIRNADVFIRTAPPATVLGDLISESDDADAHDRMVPAGDIIPDFVRLREIDTQIGLKTRTGEVARVTINIDTVSHA